MAEKEKKSRAVHAVEELTGEFAERVTALGNGEYEVLVLEGGYEPARLLVTVSDTGETRLYYK